MEAGLYDPEAADAGERLELLEYIASFGYAAREMAGLSLDDLLRLPSDRILQPVGQMTAIELGAAAGEDPEEVIETLTRFWRAAGLPIPDPSERSYTSGDVEMLAALLSTTEFFEEEVALQLLRVIGTSLARIADAVVSAYLTEIEHRINLSGNSPIEHARANYEGVATLQRSSTWFPELLRHHVQQAVRRSRSARDGVSHHQAVRMAVGFIDLSGYTPLTEALPMSELSELIANFEATAADIIHEADGRLVKLVGDEVMFVVVDPLAACGVALELVDAFGSSEGIAARGGLAYGELLWREGDYYGPFVNAASRMVDQAVPGEVLTSTEVHEILESHQADAVAGVGRSSEFSTTPAGRRTLKGFREPMRLWTLERSTTPH